jgi:ERCC4-type nuclease
MPEPLPIVIDTREQQPWSFGDLAAVSRGTLLAGDYAIAGDHAFAVERKSLDDFASTVTSGWACFRRELERMRLAEFPARVIIVEAEWMDVLRHEYSSPAVIPPLILRRVAELTMDGVSVLFCGNPTAAAGLCWRILTERYYRLMESGNDGED